MHGGCKSTLKHPPRTRSERQATPARIFLALDTFARSALGLEKRHMDVILSHDFGQLATEFPRMARRFDPTISEADIFEPAATPATTSISWDSRRFQ